MVSLEFFRGFLTGWRLSSKRRTCSTALSDRRIWFKWMRLYETIPNILSNYIAQYETMYETNRHIDLLIQQIRLMPSNAAKKTHPPFPGDLVLDQLLVLRCGCSTWEDRSKKKDGSYRAGTIIGRHVISTKCIYGFILGLVTFWELSYLLWPNQVPRSGRQTSKSTGHLTGNCMVIVYHINWFRIRSIKYSRTHQFTLGK